MSSTVVTVVLWVVVALVVCVVFLAAVRFFTLRSKGTPMLMRSVPAKDTRGWRHGVISYAGEFVENYELRSVSPSCDRRFNRRDIEILGTRALDDEEAVFISSSMKAVHIIVRNQQYELALAPHAHMAFSAWVEAAPSQRQESRDFRHLRKKMERPMRTNLPHDIASWQSYYE